MTTTDPSTGRKPGDTTVSVEIRGLAPAARTEARNTPRTDEH